MQWLKSIYRKIRRRLGYDNELNRGFVAWDRYARQMDAVLPAPEHLIPDSTDRCAVIVESRRHPHLSFVLKNTMHFLGPEWGLHIFCSPHNEQFTRKLVKGWGAVTVDVLPNKLTTKQGYSDLLASPQFWRRLNSETVLIFQTDSCLCRRGVEAFLDYDYIGAPWGEEAQEGVNCGLLIGNGGLSLRKRSVMQDIAERYPYDGEYPEDLYFSKILHDEGAKLPSLRVAKSFAMESVKSKDPFGLHNPWKFPCLWEDLPGVFESIDYSLNNCVISRSYDSRPINS